MSVNASPGAKMGFIAKCFRGFAPDPTGGLRTPPDPQFIGRPPTGVGFAPSGLNWMVYHIRKKVRCTFLNLIATLNILHNQSF